MVDFINEWISAPYEAQQFDRRRVLAGLTWMDLEAQKRFRKPFARLTEAQKNAICDDVCHIPSAKPEFHEAAEFFALYRNLTASGFYTCPAAWKDIGYIGNVPLQQFDGPPSQVLKQLGLH